MFKNIEQAQKNLNVVKIIFELADGTGINIHNQLCIALLDTCLRDFYLMTLFVTAPYHVATLSSGSENNNSDCMYIFFQLHLFCKHI